MITIINDAGRLTGHRMKKNWTRIPQFILLTIACAVSTVLAPLSAASSAFGGWSSNVIGISEVHLSADFWVDQLAHPEAVIMSRAKIDAFNALSFKKDPDLVDLAKYPDQLPGNQIRTTINAISKPNASNLYTPQNELFTQDDYARLAANTDLDSIADNVKVRFALVLRRADMRTWPTNERVIKSEQTSDLDRFQENALFPGDAVTVLHESADGLWYFVQSYNYAAWVEKEAVAVGFRADVLSYKSSGPILVITGDKVSTNYNPLIPAISELQLDMGVALPLAAPDEISHDINGQNPYTSHVVRLPVRKDDDRLGFELALIARRHDVHVGYLPYTAKNILVQGFKFLGERYGWGHSYNARDCTGLVSEIYKTFGILLPRNSGQQGSSPIGQNHPLTEQDSMEDRLAALQTMQPGALIFSPGHVMMYIGTDHGEPYVLHDTSSGLTYRNEDGSYYRGVLNGVSVTPFIPLQVSEGYGYIDKMYNIKQIR